MKLSKTARTILRKKFKKKGKVVESNEDGSLFYYEDDTHKETLEKRKTKRINKRKGIKDVEHKPDTKRKRNNSDSSPRDTDDI